MRRAPFLLALASLAALLGAEPARPAPQIVNRINGIGLIDYSHKPTWKVGDYVTYHMISNSAMGMHDDYFLTVLIAGEEWWWGEKCFWVETWTDATGREPRAEAALMSYAAFDDSVPEQHFEFYRRKNMSGVMENGSPAEDITRLASGVALARTLTEKPLIWYVDTLEADTVQTPVGLFHARKVRIRQGNGQTTTLGDSSVYNETRDTHVRWYTRDVPVAGVAKEEVETLIQRRTWMIGRSGEGAPLHVRERGVGTARLIACGHGLKARLVPLDRQHAVPDVDPATIAASPPPAKPAAHAPARRTGK
ncbi:MAG TPA: hypothetical protein VMH61_03060 [Candidatus Acidoferrales bacterium]|nr:hypothetical protein [Candidatus Acidoferrales bacterium]